MMTKYPQESETITDDSFEQWAREGYEIAKTDVYPDFTENELPSDYYKERALPIIENRMAQAGRRMADLFISIFDSQMHQNTIKDLILDEQFLQ